MAWRSLPQARASARGSPQAPSAVSRRSPSTAPTASQVESTTSKASSTRSASSGSTVPSTSGQSLMAATRAAGSALAPTPPRTRPITAPTQSASSSTMTEASSSGSRPLDSRIAISALAAASHGSADRVDGRVVPVEAGSQALAGRGQLPGRCLRQRRSRQRLPQDLDRLGLGIRPLGQELLVVLGLLVPVVLDRRVLGWDLATAGHHLWVSNTGLGRRAGADQPDAEMPFIAVVEQE